jgi:hypothetical protein
VLPQQHVSDELGGLVDVDVHTYIATGVEHLKHPASTLLQQYQRCGAPIIMKTSPLSATNIDKTIKHSPHKSALQELMLLWLEFTTVMRKGQWTLLPAPLAHKLKRLCISPIEVVAQCNNRPRTIVYYSFYNMNNDTAHVAPNEYMQFGQAFHRILYVILKANHGVVPIHMCKMHIANGLYRVWLLPADLPKIGVIFPTKEGEDPLLGFPLALPIGWVNSPTYFNAAMETI